MAESGILNTVEHFISFGAPKWHPRVYFNDLCGPKCIIFKHLTHTHKMWEASQSNRPAWHTDILKNSSADVVASFTYEI